MMLRTYCINHLIDNDCSPDDTLDIPGIAQMWVNTINGQMCSVPYEDELALTTYCHIFYELRVDPPKEHGYDSDYAVYSGWRETQLPKAEISKRQGDEN